MDLPTAKSLIGKSIKIAPRDGTHAHVIAKLIGVNDKSLTAEVQPKNHRKTEYVELKYLLKWKKGLAMNGDYDLISDGNEKNEMKKDFRESKFVLTCVDPEVLFYGVKQNWTKHYENAKLYDKKGNANRAMGRMARKPNGLRVITYIEAKELWNNVRGMTSTSTSSDNKPTVTYNIDKKPSTSTSSDNKPTVTYNIDKKPNTSNDKIEADEVLDDIASILKKRETLQQSLSDIDKQIEELNTKRVQTVEELSKIASDIKTVSELL